MLKEEIRKLNNYIDLIETEWGGDIEFRQTISEELFKETEEFLNFQLPAIFKWLYINKTNGLKFDNKSILSIYDSHNKKTSVENINRFNDPTKGLYFKERPHIFNDYVIIGYEHNTLVCLSKKYNLDNPLLYSCSDYNNSKGVNFYCMDINLEGFIKKIVIDSFEDETENDLILI